LIGERRAPDHGGDRRDRQREAGKGNESARCRASAQRRSDAGWRMYARSRPHPRITA
jgi:hypothetical protein